MEKIKEASNLLKELSVRLSNEIKAVEEAIAVNIGTEFNTNQNNKENTMEKKNVVIVNPPYRNKFVSCWHKAAYLIKYGEIFTPAKFVNVDSTDGFNVSFVNPPYASNTSEMCIC